MTIRNSRTPPPTATRSGATPVAPGPTSSTRPGGPPVSSPGTLGARATGRSDALRRTGTGVGAVKDQVDTSSASSAPRDNAADDGDLNAAVAKATTPEGKLRRSKAPPHSTKTSAATSGSSSRGSSSSGGSRSASVGRGSSAARRGASRGRGGGDEHVDRARSLKSVHGAEGNKEDPGADRGRKGHSGTGAAEHSDWRMKAPLPAAASPRPSSPSPSTRPRSAPPTPARAGVAESRLRGQLAGRLERREPAGAERRTLPSEPASREGPALRDAAPEARPAAPGTRNADLARELHEEEMRLAAPGAAALAGAAGAAALAAAWDDDDQLAVAASASEGGVEPLRASAPADLQEGPAFPAPLEADFRALAHDVPKGDLLEVAARAEAAEAGVAFGLGDDFQPIVELGARSAGSEGDARAQEMGARPDVDSELSAERRGSPDEARAERTSVGRGDDPDAAPASAATPDHAWPQAGHSSPADDSPGFNAASRDAGGSDVVNSQVAGSQVAGSEIADGQVAGSQVAGGQVADSETADSEIADGQVAGSQFADSEIADSGVADRGPQATESDALPGSARGGGDRDETSAVLRDEVGPVAGLEGRAPEGALGADSSPAGRSEATDADLDADPDLEVRGTGGVGREDASAPAEADAPQGAVKGSAEGAVEPRPATSGAEVELAPAWLPDSASALGGELHAVDLAQQEVDAEDALAASAAEAKGGRTAAPGADAFDDFAATMFEEGAGIDGVLLSPEQRARAADYGLPFVQDGERVAGNPALVRAELLDMASILAGLKVDVSDITSGLQTLLDSDGGGDDGGGEGDAEGEADGDE